MNLAQLTLTMTGSLARLITKTNKLTMNGEPLRPLALFLRGREDTQKKLHCQLWSPPCTRTHQFHFQCLLFHSKVPSVQQRKQQLQEGPTPSLPPPQSPLAPLPPLKPSDRTPLVCHSTSLHTAPTQSGYDGSQGAEYKSITSFAAFIHHSENVLANHAYISADDEMETFQFHDLIAFQACVIFSRRKMTLTCPHITTH